MARGSIFNRKTVGGAAAAGGLAAVRWLATHSVENELKSADGYFAQNLRWAGLQHPPAALATSTADHWISVAATCALIMALALVLWGAIFRKSKPAKETIPLFAAAWYIARDSKWAASYLKEHDEQWIRRLGREIVSKLSTNRLHAWGTFAPKRQVGNTSPSPIPSKFWENAGLTLEDLCSDRPVWGSVHGDAGDYYDIELDAAEVHALWPRRSWWARLRRKSPVERIEHFAPLKRIWAHLRGHDRPMTYRDLEKAQREQYDRCDYGR